MSKSGLSSITFHMLVKLWIKLLSADNIFSSCHFHNDGHMRRYNSPAFEPIPNMALQHRADIELGIFYEILHRSCQLGLTAVEVCNGLFNQLGVVWLSIIARGISVHTPTIMQLYYLFNTFAFYVSMHLHYLCAVCNDAWYKCEI